MEKCQAHPECVFSACTWLSPVPQRTRSLAPGKSLSSPSESPSAAPLPDQSPVLQFPLPEASGSRWPGQETARPGTSSRLGPAPPRTGAGVASVQGEGGRSPRAVGFSPHLPFSRSCFLPPARVERLEPRNAGILKARGGDRGSWGVLASTVRGTQLQSPGASLVLHPKR